MRRFPPPWTVESIPGGFKVCDHGEIQPRLALGWPLRCDVRALDPQGNSSSWSAVEAPKRDYGDLTMKTQLILIASALLLVSNVAEAQEPNAPSAGQDSHMGGGMMGGEDTMGHMGGHEMGYMGDEDTMGHMGGGMMCHGMKGHGMMGHGMFKRMIFALMDTDGDGTISLEEFQAAHAKIFKAMDTNKDGKLTPAGIEAFMSGGSPAPNQ